MDKVAATVSRLLLATSRSADYTNSLIMFNQIKSFIIKKRPKKPRRSTPKSPNKQKLKLRFSNAIATLQNTTFA